MKILLVNTNIIAVPYPVPPLGLCIIAKQLQKDHQVLLYDAFSQGVEQLVPAALEFSPDVICLGIRNVDDMHSFQPHFFLQEIRDLIVLPLRKSCSAPLILGGSGFSLMPCEVLEYLGGDYGIAGEGEQSLPLLLQRIESGRPLPVPGLLCPGDKEVQRTSGTYCSSIVRADIFSFLDFGPYRQRGAYPVQTKRGCARKCIYCVYPLIEGSSYRLRDPREVVDEIEIAAGEAAPATFEFVDSTFNDPPGHAMDICREIIRRRLKLRLRTMGINPGCCSEQLFELMMQAGFAQIDCTPDTASPSMLHNMHKDFTHRQLCRTAELIRSMNLPAMWFFLFGGPGETPETVEESFEFIDRYVHPDDLVHLTAGMRIYPGTELHRIALHEGVVSPSQSLLQPVFYFSPAMPEKALRHALAQASASRPNCVQEFESAPGPAMMEEAMLLRQQQQLDEPMFRTLLRIRKRDMAKGKSPS